MKGEGVGEELAKRVGAAIAAQRKAAGYTQSRVGDVLGLEKETVSRIETGAITPTLHRLGQFADLFRCPISALFGEYRGKSGEDGAQIAELIADLSPEARRAALRMLSEFATTARERDDLREQVERMRAELEHRVLSDSLPQAPAKTRRRLKV
ncbi:helix-turn-helix domain-containing protein [Paraburkholderia kururiensis]|uniref:helix-turn-helix domain-containing protein n=1 Tax=Paraburkholderia kururiensis TaxID=984307 RepID=UPI00037A5EE6|nr:helix-turn-helix transcriptional regulator [Paraburkholderia kururiensis]